MKERFSLGQMGKLDVTAESSAAGGLLLLWAVFSLLGIRLYRLRPGAAITGGLAAAVAHFFSELWHQLGHARAAEKSGYPMEGVHLWGVLGTSVYPAGEPELPPEVHVERALGGPNASLRALAAGLLLSALNWPISRPGFMVASLFALDNLFIFVIGALLPLPFLETDGITLQRYRENHRKRMIVVQE